MAVTEALALLIGASTSHWPTVTLPISPTVPRARLLGWLHFGKVPILVILVIFLTTFALGGFVAQFVAKQRDRVLPAVAGGGGARVRCRRCSASASSAGRWAGSSRKDETTAVSDASLVGRVGTIVIGTARAGRPAEARVRDEHGTSHYVMVEPEGPDQAFESGASVLLVRHLSGRRFHAIHNPKPELL